MLEDPPFDWRAVRNARSEDVRGWMLDVRRRQTEALTKPIAERLQALGGANVGEYWLSPSVAAQVPAGVVSRILAWPDVQDVGMFEPLTLQRGYDGQQARDGMRLTTFISHGYTGSSGGRAGGRVRIGIIDDCTSLFSSHNGFKRWYPMPPLGRWISSIRKKHRCDSLACTLVPPAATIPEILQRQNGTYPGSHGDDVARILVGSIEGGQDPGITDPTERIRRSGIVGRGQADTYYYTHYSDGPYACQGTYGQYKRALEQAVYEGVDVLNLSGGAVTCDRAYDANGANGELKNAMDAGRMVVAAIGNYGDPGHCTAIWPAIRAETLAVAALRTRETDPYDTADINKTSVGGMTVVADNGATLPRAFAVADLSAPGTWAYSYREPFPYPAPNPGSYDEADAFNGWSSYATPAVSGAAVLLKHAWHETVGTTLDGWELLTSMLLMGDGWAKQLGVKTVRGFDRRSGAGRVHMHYPSFLNLGFPWGWGLGSFVVNRYEVVALDVNNLDPLPSNVTHLKVVMTFEEKGAYDNVADIDLYVVNRCPSGGGTTLVNYDVSKDIRKRVVVFQADLAGACVQIRTYGHSVPSGETRTAHVAYYYHSTDPAHH